MSLHPSAVGVVDGAAAAARWRVREWVSASVLCYVPLGRFFGVLPLRVLRVRPGVGEIFTVACFAPDHAPDQERLRRAQTRSKKEKGPERREAKDPSLCGDAA